MENFVGKIRIERNYKRLMNLHTVIEKLKKQEDSLFQIEVHYGDTDNTHKNAIVGFETNSPMLLMQLNQRSALAELIMLSDDVSTVYVKETGKIRFVFGVRDIWEE